MTTPVGSLTAAEIAIRVKRQFGDEAGSQVTDADIIRWINDSMREIALNNNLLQVKASTVVAQGMSEYQIPNDVLTLRAVKFKGQTLQSLTMQEADAYIQDHESVPERQGTPTNYWIWANSINLYPAPERPGTGDLVLYYTRQPTPVTTLGDVPELPAHYHNRIVEYCIAQAYELDSDPQSYQSKMAIFQANVDKLKNSEEWTNQDYYPYITQVPDEVW